MAKQNRGLGKFPKRRPKGPMSEPGFGEGWNRAHNIDQLPGQPKRVAKRGKA